MITGPQLIDDILFHGLRFRWFQFQFAWMGRCRMAIPHSIRPDSPDIDLPSEPEQCFDPLLQQSAGTEADRLQALVFAAGGGQFFGKIASGWLFFQQCGINPDRFGVSTLLSPYIGHGFRLKNRVFAHGFFSGWGASMLD
jgi:hypothetical protein